jgi:peptidyl-prolyl cis-trans isomerase SurA
MRPLRISPRRAFAALVLTLAAFLVLPGCRRQSAPGPDVWAQVDGTPISREAVERIYRSRLAGGRAATNTEEALSFKLNILDELINNQILAAHASHARITASEAEVDNKIAELQSPYSKEEFAKKVQDQGLNMDELRRQVRQNIIITKLINKEIMARISVSDAEVAAYYDRNKASFTVPETEYHLGQILVTPFPDPEVRNLKNDDANSPATAERKIQALYARLKQGADFSTLAQEYSEDPRTASGGGDMGFIPLSSLKTNKQLMQVVDTLKVGQISGILRTQTGFHIVKLLGIESPGQHPLSDVKVQNAIRQTLRNEKEQLLKAAYIEVLRNRAKVVNYLAEQVVNGEAAPGTGK